ncbi:MAG: hypothetical protein IKE01_06145 [Clostridia bacterium]|nr:hypothetical protein [Clostridia bacterium]
MEKVKNMIRIKDVPSNTIEEAIIILKENKRAKKHEGYSKFKSNKKDDDYVIKEAELIISDYLNDSGIEKKHNYKRKIKWLRATNISLVLFLILSMIF